MNGLMLEGKNLSIVACKSTKPMGCHKVIDSLVGNIWTCTISKYM